MARAPTRVLSFPMPPDAQVSCFPFGSPDTVMLHVARSYARLSGIAPMLTPQQCVRVLSENALFEQLLDVLEGAVKVRVEREARHFSMIA